MQLASVSKLLTCSGRTIRIILTLTERYQAELLEEWETKVDC